MPEYGQVPSDWFRDVSMMLKDWKAGRGSSSPTPPLSVAGIILPVELTEDWTESNEERFAKAVAVVFDKDKNQYKKEIDGKEIDLFAPLDTAGTPPGSVGERVFAVYRGRWEVVASPAAPGELSGVVMEAIKRTPDPTSDPAEYTFGKVRVTGKSYPTKDKDGNDIEPEFDDGACLFLAKDDSSNENDEQDEIGDQDEIGEHDEQIVKGETVTLSGPYRRDNPDFDEEQEVSETNKKTLSYYIVTEYEGHYRAVLDADCKSGEWTTFTIKDSDGNSVTMAASGEMIADGFMVAGNNEHYGVYRDRSNDEYHLVIEAGPCPTR